MTVINFNNVEKIYRNNQEILKIYKAGSLLWAKPLDPNILLWLKGDNLLDSSANNLTIQNLGTGGVAVDTSTKKLGTGSLYFNNTSHLAINSNLFAVGTSDFTVEFWANLTETAGNYGLWTFGASATAPITAFFDSNMYNNSIRKYGTTLLNDSNYLNQWKHHAFVRKNGAINYYLNGVKSTVNHTDNSNISNSWFLIGLYLLRSSGYHMTGYLDSFKITKSALYSATFDPNTQASNNY